MRIASSELIAELVSITNKHITQARLFESMRLTDLNKKRNDDSWSILECLEHLNLYGDFYLHEIKRCLDKSKKNKGADLFKTGVIGHYFTQSMLPKNGKIKKMKTFKDKDPKNSELGTDVFERFQKQSEELLDILERSKTVNLKKIKTAISISNVIKLRLGDTLRFYTYHQVRHMLQAQNAKKLFA